MIINVLDYLEKSADTFPGIINYSKYYADFSTILHIFRSLN